MLSVLLGRQRQSGEDRLIVVRILIMSHTVVDADVFFRDFMRARGLVGKGRCIRLGRLRCEQGRSFITHISVKHTMRSLLYEEAVSFMMNMM